MVSVQNFIALFIVLSISIMRVSDLVFSARPALGCFLHSRFMISRVVLQPGGAEGNVYASQLQGPSFNPELTLQFSMLSLCTMFSSHLSITSQLVSWTLCLPMSINECVSVYSAQYRIAKTQTIS